MSKRVDLTVSKRSKLMLSIILVLLLLFILGTFAFRLFTDYIWMDSLSFGSVYTTVLYTKVLLGVSGFVLFFVLTFGTIYWLRVSYMNHFSYVQLPPIVKLKVRIPDYDFHLDNDRYDRKRYCTGVAGNRH